MEELWLNGIKMDLYPNSVRNTFQINNIAELKDRQANYSNRIKLPPTPNNIEALESFKIIGSNSRIVYSRIEARYIVQGYELISKGTAIIPESDFDISVIVYSGNSGLFNSIKGFRVNTLPFEDLNHILDISVWENSLNNSEGYIYALADFGYYPESQFVEVSRQAPSLFMHTIWDKILTEAGFTYSGDVFQNADFLTEVIPPKFGYSVENSTVTETDEGTSTAPNLTIEEGPFSNQTFIVKTFELSGSLGPDITREGNNVRSNFTGTLRISLDYVYSITTGRADVILVKNGNDNIIDFLDQGSPQSFVYEIAVETGDLLRFDLRGVTQDNGIFHTVNVTSSLSVSFSKLDGGLYIDFNKIAINDLRSDFLKDVMQRYGIIYRQTSDTHYEFKQLEELLNDRDNAEDWSEKLSSLGKEKYKIGRYGQKSEASYRYEENVEAHKDGSFFVDDQTLPEEVTIFSSIFTISELSSERVDGNQLRALRVWEPDFDGNTLVEVKNVEDKSRIFRVQFINSNFDAQFILPGSTTTIDGPTPFLSLEKIDMAFYLSNFYPGVSRLLNRAKLQSAEFVLTVEDAYNLDFFRLKYLKQTGQYYYLNKVSNFREGRISNVELVQSNGLTFNSPPTILGSNSFSIPHGSNKVLSLADFKNTTPAYFDPEFDEVEEVRILSFGNSDIKIRVNGVVITSQTDIPASNFSVEIDDLGTDTDEHSASFAFAIKDSGSGSFSTVEGSIDVTVFEKVNEPPSAFAGIDRQILHPGNTPGDYAITLEGSGTDPEGGSLAYSWQVLGAPFSVTSETPVEGDPKKLKLTYTVTLNGLHDVSFSCRLTVTDPQGLTDTDEVVVTIIDQSQT